MIAIARVTKARAPAARWLPCGAQHAYCGLLLRTDIATTAALPPRAVDEPLYNVPPLDPSRVAAPVGESVTVVHESSAIAFLAAGEKRSSTALAATTETTPFHLVRCKPATPAMQAMPSAEAMTPTSD